MNPPAPLADLIDDALPQTQCTRCGFPDCRGYAQAIASGEADIDRCPPGGAEGIERLSRVTGRPVIPLNPANGIEGPRRVARIDEAWCIGCTLCIKACPVDCIVGASKRMHTVVESQCTGCELCIPVCPVDCIDLVGVTGARTGWAAWSAQEAADARRRYESRRTRLERERVEHDERLERKAKAKLADLASHTRLTDPADIDRKRQVIEAALARVQARKAQAGPTE